MHRLFVELIGNPYAFAPYAEDPHDEEDHRRRRRLRRKPARRRRPPEPRHRPTSRAA